MRKKRPKPAVGLDADLAKLYQAFLTVGQDVETQVRWLTDFVGRDLKDPVVCEVARWEVDAFVQNWSVRWNIEPFRSLFESREQPKFLIASGVFVGPIAPQRPAPFCPPDFGVDVVLTMQQEADRLLKALLREHRDTDTDGYEFPDGVFTHLSIKGLARRAHIVTPVDPRLRFVGAMASLLLAAGPLRFCEDCRRLFVSRRGWQRFCSPRCTNRASQEKHRQKQAASKGGTK
jgi:hypothetical protein